jgi:hypothetical protein
MVFGFNWKTKLGLKNKFRYSYAVSNWTGWTGGSDSRGTLSPIFSPLSFSAV